MTDLITINTQSSIRIGGSKVLYFDPFRITDAAHDADLIFITHDHFDHFSPEDIRKIAKPDTLFVAPDSLRPVLQNADITNALFLIPGETANIAGIPVETVPSYNLLKPFHPKKNGWLGYIVTVEGQRIYVSGDMDATKEAKSVSCDIACIPIGGTYTMNVREAAAYINTIRPKVAIPTHYGTIIGKSSDGESFKKLVDPEIKVILKLS